MYTLFCILYVPQHEKRRKGGFIFHVGGYPGVPNLAGDGFGAFNQTNVLLNKLNLYLCLQSKKPSIQTKSVMIFLASLGSSLGTALLRHLARFERFNPPRPCLNVKMKESARKSQNPLWLAAAIAL